MHTFSPATVPSTLTHEQGGMNALEHGLPLTTPAMLVCFECDQAISEGCELSIYEASTDPEYWGKVCAALRTLERLERGEPVAGVARCEVCGDTAKRMTTYVPKLYHKR